MTIKNTVLQEALALLQKEGLHGISEEQLVHRLGISMATFQELFGSKENLVLEVVQYDVQGRKQAHAALFKNESSAVRKLLMVVEHGLQLLRQANPLLIVELIEHYPRAWNVYLDYNSGYSAHLVHDLLNEGVLGGDLRRDINIHLVTKILMEQVAMLVNPAVFPPETYNLGEAFRSIFLYYIRGLCTEEGMKKAEEFFSRTASF
ncbi:TetR family transcriptional regulator [Nibribacter ruber]|uniref:TetR family transcriptional regulator n=1 Tax=Nibribacter ruber TaxID=2698458 RepID=A0A6P1NWB6_9BACT|nr:TetR/AcrR family transcriptional regulator [Nibribacter ruber]QHL88126.1 TetR family transcriptional regulator [Nibribacter ruber]